MALALTKLKDVTDGIFSTGQRISNLVLYSFSCRFLNKFSSFFEDVKASIEIFEALQENDFVVVKENPKNSKGKKYHFDYFLKLHIYDCRHSLKSVSSF